MRRRVLAAGLLWAALATASLLAAQPIGGPGQPAISEAALASLDPAIEPFRNEHKLPGLAIGIVVGDNLIWSRALGVQDKRTGAPVTEDTLFQIGSITKTFTATLLAMCVDRGLLAWDDPAAEHLAGDISGPLRKDADPPLTIRLLANHRSGLASRPATLPEEQRDGLVRSFSHFQLEQSIRNAALDRPPGEAFGYSNFGYAVLGLALERVTDTPFESLLKQWIFSPLRMDRSTITLLPEHVPLLATPYALDEGAEEQRETMPQNLDALAPAGGIWSSVRELAPFLSLHLKAPAASEAVSLSDQQRQALYDALPVSAESSLRYGLGWGRTQLGFGDAIFHDGGSEGFTSYIGFSLADNVGVIVLANLGSRAAARPIRSFGHSLLTWAVQQIRSDAASR